MNGALANALLPVAAAALFGSTWALWTRRMRLWRLLAVAGLGMLLTVCLLEQAWFGATWNAVLIAVILGEDWWKRKGKRAAKAAGAKSRALVENLVERVRGAVSPVPQGARA